MKLFRKKEIFKVKSVPVDPASVPDPQTAEEYTHRGMIFYARNQYEPAEQDLRAAIRLNPRSVDAFYDLGMVCKALGKKEDAINAFQQAIDLLEAGVIENRNRVEMLRRLAKGHINTMVTGDWNLEKEIWQRVG